MVDTPEQLDLRELLGAWVAEAFAFLREQADELLALYAREVWQLGDDGTSTYLHARYR